MAENIKAKREAGLIKKNHGYRNSYPENFQYFLLIPLPPQKMNIIKPTKHCQLWNILIHGVSLHIGQKMFLMPTR